MAQGINVCRQTWKLEYKPDTTWGQRDLMDQMHVLLNVLEKNGALVGNKTFHFIWLNSAATKH